jgi:hypothetical protein
MNMVSLTAKKDLCSFISLVMCLLLLISCQKEVEFPYKSSDYGNPAVVQERNRIGAIKSLETINSFPGRWCCINDGYMYGIDTKDPTLVIRKTLNGQVVEKRGNVTSLDQSYVIELKMYSCAKPGLLFIIVRGANGDYLLKSIDGAATFKKVFVFGEGNGPGGTNATEVRLLRGILELNRDIPSGGGKGTLFIPEYNVCKGRIAGSTNDRVRIMKSEDDGDTWTKLVEWNTNMKNQVGHIHAMKQDPYTGEIYICVGDDNAKSGLIKWNGSSPWADNKTMQEIKTMEGFRVLSGAQKYRSCDVLFDEGNFYTFADTQDPNNPNGAESGIWKGSKDFSSFVRVDNQIYDYDHMHIGWFGEKIRDTFIFTTSREYTNATNHWNEINTKIYSSTDGIHWYASGILDWPLEGSLNRYLYNVFSYNDKLYIDCYGGAGHYSTIECSLSKVWKSYEDPVILHPVYFVGNWNSPGNDANSGTNADAPKQTLASMLDFNKISAGSRVRVSAGEYNEGEINPLWSSVWLLHSKGGVIIEGQGMDNTRIKLSTAPGKSGITVIASRTLTSPTAPLTIKDLSISMSALTGTTHNNYIINNTDTYVKSINCIIGSTDNDCSPLVRLGSAGAMYNSENSMHIASSATDTFRLIVETGADNTTIQLKNCIILNAWNAFHIDRQGTILRLKNCTFYNIKNHAVAFNAESQTFIKNCIFSTGSAPFDNASATSSAEIGYNLYSKRNINISEGFSSLTVGLDPGFADAGNLNFHLRENTPCRLKGIYLPDVGYDFLGKSRNNPPAIGAFER